MTPRAVALLALVAAAGCGSWSTHVRPGDAAITRAAEPRDPEVFVDRLPPRRYAVAGIIEVRAPSGQPMSAFLPHAVARARELGCDVLVARHLHLGLRHDRPPTLVAQRYGGHMGTNPTGEVLGDEGGKRKKREFVCGVYERS